MDLKGKVFKFGDDINTDYIIAGKYRSKGLDMKVLAQHLMEDLDPDFTKKIKKGDFIVAGDNFGCGSSREYAPKVIVEAGIGGVIANSFARIFYRNAVNSGLLVIECDTSGLEQGDIINISLKEGFIINETKNTTIKFKQIPPFMAKIIAEGGMVNFLKKYGDLDLETL